MTEFDLQHVKARIRLIQLLLAAEHAALAPISVDKLHAFAFLADILSPVWGLHPFEDRVGRTDRPPYFPDLQIQLDLLVGMGIVEPSEVSYRKETDGGTRFFASFALRFDSSHLRKIEVALSEDAQGVLEQKYLNALAEALASLPDEEISRAATKDLAYERFGSDDDDYVDLDPIGRKSRSARAIASFDRAFPATHLTAARRLYMYAHYLGKRAHG
ncbi:hypothetical protein [Agrobacterium salinitolerans]|uniref:hypothetical protein n=1 Tax=Agrobacterium salinitolerans TaxID=1183413 RepID=UPI001573C4DF|nr:hypothetical protein [Agrobacterium salinitolerans]NTA36689.1 hypothetical protein [Agrobacterium salinitolerans]NTA36751.1 hypothetical protein [Agrobacterium salinitolerans]